MYKKCLSIIMMIITIIMISCNIVVAAQTWKDYDVSQYENATDMNTAETLYKALMLK